MSIKRLIPNGPKGLIAKPNKDGTFRVYFQAPKDRPAGFPSTTPLPFHNRTGRLEPDELAAIERDAWEVHRELEDAQVADFDAGGRTITWAELGEAWVGLTAFKSLKPETKVMHSYWGRRIAAVFDKDPKLAPQTITVSAIDRAFQEHFSEGNRPRCQTSIRAMLDVAVADGLRPPIDVRLNLRRPRMVARPIWDVSDLDEYEAALKADGQYAMAGLIVVAMELAQRVGDVSAFRMGKHFTSDGWFRYHQSKTNAWVSFPAPPRVRQIIEDLSTPDGELIFANTGGKPFTSRALTGRFHYYRTKYLASGRVSQNRMLQTLRHSGVMELARAGCTIPEIGSLTGHSYKYIQEMMEVYLRRDSVCAINAIQRREAWRNHTREHGDTPHIKQLGAERVFILPAADGQPTIH